MLPLSAKFFILLGEVEHKSEIVRQVLTELLDFEPYDLYRFLLSDEPELSIGVFNSYYFYEQCLQKFISELGLKIKQEDLTTILKVQKFLSYESFLFFILPSSNTALRHFKLIDLKPYVQPPSECICALLKVFQFETEFLELSRDVKNQILQLCAHNPQAIFSKICDKKGLITAKSLFLFITNQGYDITDENLINIMRRLGNDVLKLDDFYKLLVDEESQNVIEPNVSSLSASKTIQRQKSSSSYNSAPSKQNKLRQNNLIRSTHFNVLDIADQTQKQKVTVLKEKRSSNFMNTSFTQMPRTNKAYELRQMSQQRKQKEQIQVSSSSIKPSRKQQFVKNNNKNKNSFQGINISIPNKENSQLLDYGLTIQTVLSQNLPQKHFTQSDQYYEDLLEDIQKNPQSQLVKFDNSYEQSQTLYSVLSESMIQEVSERKFSKETPEFDIDVDEFMLYITSLVKTFYQLEKIIMGQEQQIILYIKSILDKYVSDGVLNVHEFGLDQGILMDKKDISKLKRFWNVDSITKEIFLEIFNCSQTSETIDIVYDDQQNGKTIKSILKQYLEFIIQKEQENYQDKLTFFKKKKLSLIHLFDQIDLDKKGSIIVDDLVKLIGKYNVQTTNNTTNSIFRKISGLDGFPITFKKFLKELTP